MASLVRDPRSQRALHALLLLLFFGFIVALLVGRAMSTGLAHDEYHYVVGGKLLADSGALPYVDYPYIHTPYLAFAYALIFLVTDYTLLAARLFSVACMALSVGLIFYFAYDLLRGKPWWARFLLGAFGGLALVTSPLFIRVGGLAVNHQLPTLLTLLALFVFLRGRERSPNKRYLFVTGLLIGLAAGTRISYLLALVPFGVALGLPINSKDLRTQIKDLILLSLGTGLALLPLVALFALAPKGFIFGNYVYFQLNAAYRQALAHPYGMTPLGKLTYFGRFVLSEAPTAALSLAFLVYLGIALRASRREGNGANSRLLLIAGLSILLFFTAFIGTPTWAQYFFTPVPFIILAVLAGIAAAWEKRAALNWGAVGLLLVAQVLTGSPGEIANNLGALASPEAWYPLQAHELGLEIQAEIGEGKVLSLAPVFPLEGGLGIYGQFAAGPFIWRTAQLLSAEKRAEYEVISYFELEAYLDQQPPEAILTGFELEYDGFTLGEVGGLEQPLIDYASEHGYQPLLLSNPFGYENIVLWLR